METNVSEYSDRRSSFDAGEGNDRKNTLLPMLLIGLILVVIGAGVVMTTA